MEEEAKQESAQRTSGGSGKIIGIIVIVVILALGGFLYEQRATQKSTETAMTPQKKVSAPSAGPTTAISQSVMSPSAKSQFKDGTYTAEGDYITHVGQKHIKVTITIKNDIITNSDVVNEADDPYSERMQDSFIGGYKSMVIGKDITQVHLGKVALSSLTPNGFNSALQAIEQQAKS